MMFRLLFAAIVPALLLVSCSPPQVLDVRPMHVREVGLGDSDDPMIRGDYQRRFYGAVGMSEQGDRLGYTYTVLWNESSVSGPGEIVFEYQQGSSGSRVNKMVHKIESGATSGRAEFALLGDAYRKGGRVLAWRCKLIRDGREIASRRSYLWQ